MKEPKFKPDDWVEIINEMMPNGYSNGDVLKIKDMYDGGGVYHLLIYPDSTGHTSLVFEQEAEKTFRSMVEGAVRDEEERLNKTKNKK